MHDVTGDRARNQAANDGLGGIDGPARHADAGAIAAQNDAGEHRP
jgi:hypothetical protein